MTPRHELTRDAVLDKDDTPPLRPPPQWVTDGTWSRNQFAWEDTKRPTDLLAWLDDDLEHHGENATTRRIVGAAVLEAVRSRVSDPGPHATDAPSRQVHRILATARLWIDGKDFSPADVEALEQDSQKIRRKLEVREIDAREAAGPPPEGYVEAYSGVPSTANLYSETIRHALMPFAAMSGSLISFGYRLQEMGSGAPDRFLRRLRELMPSPPPSYAEPLPPRRYSNF